MESSNTIMNIPEKCNKLLSIVIKPEFINEEQRRKTYILNIILVSLIVLLLTANVILIGKELLRAENTSAEYAMSVISSLLILLFLIGLLKLSIMGKERLSALILILSLFILNTKMALQWGIELPSAIILYVILIIISSILIRSKFAFTVAAIVSLAISAMNYLQIRSITSPDLGWKTENWDTANIITLSIILFIVATVSWLSNREMEKSVTRANQSEKLLQIHNDLLDIQVLNKTKELKASQAKELSRINQLAEFGKLSAYLFHELANPLTSINLNMSELEKLCNSNPAWKKFSNNVNRTTSAAKQMGRYLNSVRKQIAQEEQITNFSINKEIDEVIDILNIKAKKKSIQIITHKPNDISLINNQIKVHQLIGNLVSNSIDSFENYNQTTNKKIVIKLIRKRNKAVLKITDNGCGMSKEKKANIFKDFYSTKKAVDGSGLGLSIVKNVVKNDLKGTMRVISSPKKGSTFTINFPIK